MPYKNIERKREYSRWWARTNKEYFRTYSTKRLNTERGFLNSMWQDIKRSRHHNSFKDFDDFYNHWLKQKKVYGIKCPATGVEMTTKRAWNRKRKKETCGTNISKDRILSSGGYSHQNLIFTCWKYNNTKNSLTPKMAKTFLRIVKERYGTDEME